MSGQFCTVTIFFYASRFALFVLLKLMPCINATKRLCTYTPMPRESAIWPPVLWKHVFSRDFVTWDLGDWSRSPLLCTPPGHLRQQPWQRMYFYIQSICNPWLGLLKSPIMFCVYILRSHDRLPVVSKTINWLVLNPSLVQCVSFADYVFGEWSFPRNHIPNFIKTPLKVCRLQQISSKYNPSSLPLLRTVFLQPKICIEYKVSFYLICNRYILESKKSCHP